MTAPDPGPIPDRFDADAAADGILDGPPLAADPDFGPDGDPEESFHAKWMLEGAQTLAECAARLDAEAARLRELAAQGWELAQPVDGGNGFLLPSRG